MFEHGPAIVTLAIIWAALEDINEDEFNDMNAGFYHLSCQATVHARSSR